ncbi:MAG: hypothetical protein EXR62_04515 [Chloroflexi bacterium]|nr:hypothetical protein [Chloroflexota bacterium]
MLDLTTEQKNISHLPFRSAPLWIEGDAGTGKSTALIEHLRYLLSAGVEAYSILVLLPDRVARHRYRRDLSRLVSGPQGEVELHTYSSLAQSMVALFWPLVARSAGVSRASRPPIFISYEAAQYLMHRIIEPLLELGYFDGIHLRRQRLVSQLLDNLNKAAVNGYPLAAVESRLCGAWLGGPERLTHYHQVQETINRYRQQSLSQGILDISLSIEIFHQQLVQNETFWRYFDERYRHLVVDNVEEMVPVTHDFIRKLMQRAETTGFPISTGAGLSSPTLDSALVASDRSGGFRVFLGVDIASARNLKPLFPATQELDKSFCSSDALVALARAVDFRLREGRGSPDDALALTALGEPIITRFRAQMVEQVADQVQQMVHERDIPAGEIAIIAPYADAVLRYFLERALQARQIPLRIIRRFESLRDEPIVRTVMTLACLAHPYWQISPPAFDVAEALAMSVRRMDRARAVLATHEIYDPAIPALNSLTALRPAILERIGYANVELIEELVQWLADYASRKYPPPGVPGETSAPRQPLDLFFQQLFGEILSQQRFGLDFPQDEARMISKLVESAKRFVESTRHEALPAMDLATSDADVGRRYLEMIYQGTVAAQYLLDELPLADSVLLVTPVYTYLVGGYTSGYQFWLDVGSTGWWEPPAQPLTHPQVMSRSWPAGQPWTETDANNSRITTLTRLVTGLTQRCRKQIIVCTSQVEIGNESQDGPLWRTLQGIMLSAGSVLPRVLGAEYPRRGSGAARKAGEP